MKMFEKRIKSFMGYTPPQNQMVENKKHCMNIRRITTALIIFLITIITVTALGTYFWLTYVFTHSMGYFFYQIKNRQN